MIIIALTGYQSITWDHNCETALWLVNLDVSSCHSCFYHFKTLMLAQSLGKETWGNTMLLCCATLLAKRQGMHSETANPSKSPGLQVNVGNMRQLLYMCTQRQAVSVRVPEHSQVFNTCWVPQRQVGHVIPVPKMLPMCSRLNSILAPSCDWFRNRMFAEVIKVRMAVRSFSH